jgi:hypothetical protein
MPSGVPALQPILFSSICMALLSFLPFGKDFAASQRSNSSLTRRSSSAFCLASFSTRRRSSSAFCLASFSRRRRSSSAFCLASFSRRRRSYSAFCLASFSCSALRLLSTSANGSLSCAKSALENTVEPV